jgi:Fe-S cluster biogenesis protein NfuA
MMDTQEATQFRTQLERLDRLIRGLDRLADPAARTQAREALQALLEVHGSALDRLLEHVVSVGPVGHDIIDACGRDDVVGGLLLLHGLHPHDVETRVRQALDSVRPYLRSHGGNVELVGVDGAIVRLRLIGSCDGCPSSAVTMQQTIEQAVYGRAPEVTAIEVEGLAEHLPAMPEDGTARVALPMV